MAPRGGRKAKPKATGAELAKHIGDQVKEAVQPLRPVGGFCLGISVRILTDEEGRPCGSVIATKTPRPAHIPDAVDVPALPTSDDEAPPPKS
jgi:hypothetical protein